MAEFEVDAITDVTPMGENFRMFKEKLNYIPKKHMIRTIDGSNYLMHKLDIGIFNNFQNLIVLNLSNNMLTNIENGVFDPLLNLETIDLSVNLMSSINDLMFVNNTKLKTINLSTNALTVINSQAFSLLNDLYNLNLSSNQIDRIDYLCLNCIHLKIFDLSFNRIENITEAAFYALPELIHLNLSNNQIKLLHKKVFYLLNKVENLNLSNNKIENLNPRIFSKLHQLTILNLSSNKIKFLSFFLLKSNHKLIDLDIFNNNEIIFDKNVFICCRNLRNLKLTTHKFFNTLALKHMNSLTNFEIFSTRHQLLYFEFFKNFNTFSIKKLKIVFRNATFKMTTAINSFENLELLHIEFLRPSKKNCSINFCSRLNNLSNLQHLTLKNINRFYFIIPGYSSNFRTKNIKHLDLTGIQNESIDDLIKQFEKLEYLNLSYSNISRIEVNTMFHLNDLRCLILKNSKITSLPTGLFNYSLNLEVLDFENCPIRRIDDNVFQNLVSFKFLNLKGIRLHPITEKMLNGIPATTNVFF